MSATLVLVRHGESVYNRENRFAGWSDVPLSERGRRQAYEVAKTLVAETSSIGCSLSVAAPPSADGVHLEAAPPSEWGPIFSRIYTSVLRRAVESAQIIRASLALDDTPIVASWRLNERHYGILEGRNKAETAAEYGLDLVQRWRRGLHERPPALSSSDLRHPVHDPRYSDLPAPSPGWDAAHNYSNDSIASQPPSTESLSDAIARLLPFWHYHLVPALVEGPPILVCAHGSTVRAILTILENLDSDKILRLNIPNGYPILCNLRQIRGGEVGKPVMQMVERRYLGDARAARREAERVARQAVPPNGETSLPT